MLGRWVLRRLLSTEREGDTPFAEMLDYRWRSDSVLGDDQQGFICGPEVNAKIWHMHKYAICTMYVYTRELSNLASV